jgi:hypothetical protein
VKFRYHEERQAMTERQIEAEAPKTDLIPDVSVAVLSI